MCLGCMSNEKVLSHMVKQYEYLTTEDEDRKTELQSDNRYPKLEDFNDRSRYYGYDAVWAMNVLPMDQWTDMKVKCFVEWNYFRAGGKFNIMMEMYRSYLVELNDRDKIRSYNECIDRAESRFRVMASRAKIDIDDVDGEDGDDEDSLEDPYPFEVKGGPNNVPRHVPTFFDTMRTFGKRLYRSITQ